MISYKNRFQISELKILECITCIMVGPQDGGFGFDLSKKYSEVNNLDEICVQCQACQHKNSLNLSPHISLNMTYTVYR